MSISVASQFLHPGISGSGVPGVPVNVVPFKIWMTERMSSGPNQCWNFWWAFSAVQQEGMDTHSQQGGRCWVVLTEGTMCIKLVRDMAHAALCSMLKTNLIA